MERPGVTVVIPAFNCEKTIEKVLDAITGQKYPNYEVMVIDDGSTDGTNKIVKKYSTVKHIQNERNLGLSNSLNKGIQLSENDLIVTLHSDCVPQTNNWLAHMVEMVTTDEKIGAVSSSYTLPKEIWENLDFIPKLLFASWVNQPLGFLNNKCDIYKKSALSNVDFFASKYFRVGGEDIDMIYKLNQAGYKIKTNEKDLVYHIHAEKITLLEYFRKGVQRGETGGVILKRWKEINRQTIIIILFLGLFIPRGNLFAMLGLILISIRNGLLYYNNSKYLPTILLIPIINFIWNILWSLGFLSGFTTGKQRF